MNKQPHCEIPPEETDPVLLKILVNALRQLGQSGRPDAANRLAAQAWSHLRFRDADSAEKINGTMHYLSRLPDDVNAPQNHQQNIAGENTDHDSSVWQTASQALSKK